MLFDELRLAKSAAKLGDKFDVGFISDTLEAICKVELGVDSLTIKLKYILKIR